MTLVVGPLRSGYPPPRPLVHEVLVSFFNDRKKCVFLSGSWGLPPSKWSDHYKNTFFMSVFPKRRVKRVRTTLYPLRSLSLYPSNKTKKYAKGWMGGGAMYNISTIKNFDTVLPLTFIINLPPRTNFSMEG